MAERHQVLVVGGGFGGLSVTKALAHADVDVTIVDRTNHHLFQPLLYQVATGILSEGVGAQTDRAGRVAVRPDYTLPGHPEVFAIGDMVSLNGLPGVAQPAMQEGKYVGKVIRARLKGNGTVAPFKYFDKGSMATIGRNAAVADAFGMKFTGRVGYLMWGFIHVQYLIGWDNRIITLYSWLRALSFTHHRGERIITVEQAHDELTRAATRRDPDEPNRLLSKRA